MSGWFDYLKTCRYTNQASTSLSNSTHSQTCRPIRFNAI